MPLQVLPGLVVPDAELSWRFSRSSGPGGQGVNTSDSRAELTVDLSRVLPEHLLARAAERGPTVLTTQSSDQRSQLQNRSVAGERMAELIRAAIAPPPAPRRATKPSRASKQRRLDVKRQRSDLKRTRRRPGRGRSGSSPEGA
ncbi:MAG: ribosome-associated protein [Frankiales bacterium]|nr:aminoacyl-tRNA hydrolase [Frankiales bacterium]MDX6217160.1 ribosome-associated protein [Frankiales bacterium]